MAKIEKQVPKKLKIITTSLPFTKLNYQILGFGILVIALGYIALAQEPWDGTMPLIVAPILLVFGYCVILPLGILFRKKKDNEINYQSSDPRL